MLIVFEKILICLLGVFNGWVVGLVWKLVSYVKLVLVGSFSWLVC